MIAVQEDSPDHFQVITPNSERWRSVAEATEYFNWVLAQIKEIEKIYRPQWEQQKKGKQPATELPAFKAKRKVKSAE